jgi:hypothetical protein
MRAEMCLLNFGEEIVKSESFGNQGIATIGQKRKRPLEKSFTKIMIKISKAQVQ